MTTITATELKENLGKYILLAQTEDIRITKNGKPAVRLVPDKMAHPAAKQNTGSIAHKLFGILPKEGMTVEEAKEMRLREKCGY